MRPLIFSYVEQLEGKVMFKKLVRCCAGFHSAPACMSVSSCAVVMRGLSQLMSSNFYVAYITCPVIGVKITSLSFENSTTDRRIALMRVHLRPSVRFVFLIVQYLHVIA